MMRHAVLPMLYGLLIACAAAADSATNPTLFPQAAGALEPDLSTQLKVPGGGTLSLDFVRFKPAAGVSQAAVPYVCGVVLRQAGKPAQAVVTVGTGKTRFWTCDGVSEDGIARMKGGGWAVAVIYNTSTPGGNSTTPVVLIPGPTGAFDVDHALAGGADTATLRDLQRMLTEH